jgi:Family of unknown function (DUF6470)
MQIPQIRLQSTLAQLSIQSSPARIEIEQPQAQMDLRQPAAVMTMEKTTPRLTIDQTQAWEDMNLKSAMRSIEEAAGEGYGAWMQYMASSSQDGDELMSIEHGGGAIAAQADRNSQSPTYDFNIGYIPSPFSVKINYQPGDVRINVQPQPVQNNTRAQKPIIHYQPGTITYSMKQHNHLQIDS